MRRQPYLPGSRTQNFPSSSLLFQLPPESLEERRT
jgi:hypothetical protein